MKYLALLKNLSNKKKIITVIAVFLLGTVGINVSQSDVSQFINLIPLTGEETVENSQEETSIKPNFNKASAISPQRRTHILYGDHTGGGHLYGTGKPCKSEFPRDWNETKIIKEMSLTAANDNLYWKKERNGYHVAENTIDGVKIRVVKGRENKQVITAYPINAQRNPCPANDR